MKSRDRRNKTKAATTLQRFRSTAKFKPLHLIGHGLALIATAFVSAAVHSSIPIATALLALVIGSILTAFTIIASDLRQSVDALGGALLRIDYQKVGAINHAGERITEAMLYKRARSMIKAATESIDIFTSSMVEPDARNEEDNESRREYFSAVLEVVRARGSSFKYRRIVQAPRDKDLNEMFARARTYRDHLSDMASLEASDPDPNVILKRLDSRRPTTYLIIDESVFVWQINAIVGQNNEMELYGMFFVEDPAQELIKHFKHEFDLYFDHQCSGVGPDLSTRV